VSIDLTAAFDVTDRGRVIREMQRHKVPHNNTKWLADIITERRFKVDYKGATSKVRHTISGVVQGTVLAPFRYNVKSNGAIVLVIGEPLVE
jgi:Reverse transcriptase (RNA-dependent DNA polymerase)